MFQAHFVKNFAGIPPKVKVDNVQSKRPRVLKYGDGLVNPVDEES